MRSLGAGGLKGPKLWADAVSCGLWGSPSCCCVLVSSRTNKPAFLKGFVWAYIVQSNY